MRYRIYEYQYHAPYHDLKSYKTYETRLDLGDNIPPYALQEIQKFTHLKSLILNTDLIDQSITEVDFPNLEQLDLVGKLGFFPAWVGKLPKLQKLVFSYRWQSALPAELASLPHLSSLHLVLHEKSEAEKVLPHLRLHGLELREASFDSPVWEAIAHCTRLRVLLVDVAFQSLDKPKFTLPASWKSLTRLMGLRFSAHNAVLTLPTEWRALKAWKEIIIHAGEIKNFPFEAENLQDVTNLDLVGAKKLDLADVLARCNPKMLTELSWSKNSLKEVPAEIGKFTNLTKLFFSFNDFARLPYEILHLDKLKVSSFRATPFEKATHLGSAWVDFVRNMQYAGWDYATQCFAMDLLQKNEEGIQKASRQHWLRVLETNVSLHLSPFHVYEYFNQYALQPLPADEDLQKAVFFLVGKPTMYHTQADFKKRMKARGLTLLPTFDDTVTHIIVGKSPVGLQKNLQQIQGFFAFEQITEWLATFETATFTEEPLETAEVDNLRLLLTSGDSRSIMLALQMMQQGGIPEALYPAFFWLPFVLSEGNKKTYSEVFKKHYPAFWQASVDKYRRKMLPTVLEELLVQQDLPTETLFMSLLRDFASQLNSLTLPTLALKCGGEPAKFIIQKKLQNGVLDFQNRYLSVIPAEIAQFPEITHLKLWDNKPLHRGLAHLKHLPNLQTIEILQKGRRDIALKINKVLPHVNVL